MKKLIYSLILLAAIPSIAQDNIYPAPKQTGILIISNASIHTGTGQVIENGTIVIKDGKIQSVGTETKNISGATVINASGKKVYPGLILANTDLGLKEISGAVRGSNDYNEIGDFNTDIKSVVAYNSDSKFINTLRSNGILLANIVPQGSLLTGATSVVQLDAWNWEDAIYLKNNGINLKMPSMMQSMRRFAFGPASTTNPLTEGYKTIDEIKDFFTAAQAYFKSGTPKETNLKFEAIKPLFEKKQKLFVNADIARQILAAIDIAKTFNIDVVIVGGSDSYLFAPLLKENNIPVILNSLHALPTLEDDDVDQPFKTPAILQNAGVLFAINDDDNNTRYRNIAFNAGTASSYGLTKEQALQAITLNAAKIIGIDNRTGSIEVGKDANIIISLGDILDMNKSIITDAFIQGRKINLENKHTQLYDRYKHRYNLK